MNTIIVIPYFGRLPSTFKLWYETITFNTNYDILFISDAKLSGYGKNNFKYVNISFEELKQYIQEKFDFKICLENPYKLCDYKPLFGDIFNEYIRGYDYWGYCDIDTIFGNIDKFIGKYLGKYDIIGLFGHFTLYRNCAYINSLYKQKGSIWPYKEVITHKEAYAFDEASGIKAIAIKNKISHVYKLNIADVSIAGNYIYILHGFNNSGIEYFKWNMGKLILIQEKNEIKEYEFMYAHFQKRKIENRVKDIGVAINDGFFITSDSVFLTNEQKYLEEYKKNYKITDNSAKYINEKLKKIAINLKKPLRQRIINDLKRVKEKYIEHNYI